MTITKKKKISFSGVLEKTRLQHAMLRRIIVQKCWEDRTRNMKTCLHVY